MNPFRSFRLLYSSTRNLSAQGSQLNCNSTSSKTKSATATGGVHRARSLDVVAKGVVHLLCNSSAEGGLCHVYLVGTRHMSQVCTDFSFLFFRKGNFLLNAGLNCYFSIYIWKIVCAINCCWKVDSTNLASIYAIEIVIVHNNFLKMLELTESII